VICNILMMPVDEIRKEFASAQKHLIESAGMIL